MAGGKDGNSSATAYAGPSRDEPVPLDQSVRDHVSRLIGKYLFFDLTEVIVWYDYTSMTVMLTEVL